MKVSSNPILYNGTIKGVKFSVGNSDDARDRSYSLVTSSDMFRNGTPYPEGVCNAHLGTINHAYKCQTCHHSKRHCLGHEGHISLNYPVWNPITFNEALKWLKLICFKCGNPVVDEALWHKFPRSKRLNEASKLARGTNKKCPNIDCKEIHPIIKRSDVKPIEPLEIFAEVYEDNKQVSKWTIYPHEAAKILSRVTPETVIKLGKQLSSHPRGFVLTNITVPAVTVRPEVQKLGGGRSTNDDLTTMLQVIIKRNDMMPAVIPNDIDMKLAKAIFDLNNAYYDFVKAGTGSTMTSIMLRFKGKTGRFRKNQMGKRVRNMCRSFICGDSRLKIDEVGVPLVFARTIQVEETVQEFNRKRLLSYVQNGRATYPGATEIIKRGSGVKHEVEFDKDIELEIGDKIMRDLIDGDIVYFNRQPSLMASNICGHKVVVIMDPSIKTLLMNVIACALNYRT